LRNMFSLRIPARGCVLPKQVAFFDAILRYS
jgi:hypothetical protein